MPPLAAAFHDWAHPVSVKARREARDRLCLYPCDGLEHAWHQSVIIRAREATPVELVVGALHEETYLCRLSGRGYLCSRSGQNGQT